MVGIKKSNKKEDAEHVYGYKKERYFWALISACGIFFIWAWVTIYHGIEILLHPKAIEHIFLSISILVIAFIVESITLGIALKSVYNKEDGLFESIMYADNASLAVILEDSVAVLWVIIALLSIFLSNLTGNYIYDGIGSIIIGLMLAVVAVFLIIWNKNYLIWKSIEIEEKEEIIDFISSFEFVDKVFHFKSEILDDDSYIIHCEIEFNGAALTKDLSQNGIFEKEYEDLKDDYIDFLKFCTYYANLIPRVMGQKINEMEQRIKKEFPKVKYIDLEIN